MPNSNASTIGGSSSGDYLLAHQTPDRLLRPGAAAHVQIVALDHVLADLHLCAEQADVGDQ